LATVGAFNRPYREFVTTVMQRFLARKKNCWAGAVGRRPRSSSRVAEGAKESDRL
jgi:hypothetical protein